jgi:hypothetical protein
LSLLLTASFLPGDGVSEEMLKEADRRVYLPMYGFTDSFNLSVAMALLVQRLFYMCPEVLRLSS